MRRIRVTGGPWPERIGCEGVDVTEPAEPLYPWHGLGRNEIVVLLENDPIGDEAGGWSWSCVLDRRDVETVDD